MEALNIPEQEVKIKKQGDALFVFDAIRKKYLKLTPEEWVRQNFIQYLVNNKGYPAGLISIEKGLKLNELQKRADAIVAEKTGEPVVLIEFKAPRVKVSQEVFEQVARYNQVFKVPYLIVSNGLDHYCAKIDFESNSFHFLKDIPEYSEL